MITETSLNEVTVGEIVASDFRAAEIFKNVGIDFCCGGKKSLEQACQEKSIDPSFLVESLQKLRASEERVFSYNDWELGFLSDYIVQNHHAYIWKTMPDMVFYTTKIAQVHGNHPELLEVANLFRRISTELNDHLKKEEEVLFPALKEVLKGNEKKKTLIRSEIKRMLGEHEFAGGAMDEINVITSGYQLPPDACNTYKVTFRLLKQFEDDLHIHVHLENNILFPKALTL
jgi:regulator of cell morphogenesis and NO signaling